jgi:hypothetical protein
MGTSGCSYPVAENMANIGVSGWAELGCDYPYLVYAGAQGSQGGDFIAGKTGSDVSSIHEVQDRIDSGNPEAVIPMFDYIYVGECDDDEWCMETVFEGQEPPGGWFTGASKYYYHITGFVVINLIDTTNSDKSIQAELVEVVRGDGEVTPSIGVGSGTCVPSQLVGVVLWE